MRGGVGLFARTKKFPIQVDHRQILFPTGTDQKAHKEAMAQAQKALAEGHMVFRYLSDEEELKFRSHARTNYVPFQPIDGIWHPVYQDECVRINHELSYYRLRREQQEVFDEAQEEKRNKKERRGERKERRGG